MAATAHNNAAATKAVIDNFSVKNYPPYPGGLDAGVRDAAPSIDGPAIDAASLPPVMAPWVAGDIGDVGVKGTAGASAGTFALSGSGGDIWNMADAFTYVFQPLPADGEITARVVNVEQVDVWTKAGVMVRASLAPGSPHAMLVGTGSNGLHMQYRTEMDGASSDVSASFVTHPAWVRLTRTGASVTGLVSYDGTTWLQVGKVDLPFSGPAYVGLVTTAHNNAAAATAVIDSVTVKLGGSTTDGGTGG